MPDLEKNESRSRLDSNNALHCFARANDRIPIYRKDNCSIMFHVRHNGPTYWKIETLLFDPCGCPYHSAFIKHCATNKTMFLTPNSKTLTLVSFRKVCVMFVCF